MACVVACVLRYDGKVAQVSASGSHDGRMRPPVGLRNRWLSKEGLKGAVVIVVYVGVFGCCHLWMAEFDGGSRLGEAVDNDCVRAHDAHEFSIDLRSQPMPLLRLTKVRAQRAHRRNFLVYVKSKYCLAEGYGLQKTKGACV